MQYHQFAAHQFQDLETAEFNIYDYSRLKFGCNLSAHSMGKELAGRFYKEYSAKLLCGNFVLIPSPYSHVENAATIMSYAFLDELNRLLVEGNGHHVEFDTIRRKSQYLQDYGKLPKEVREGMLDNDEFYLNEKFLKDKSLIFLDDVIITGTHEWKLKEILQDEGMENECFFVYYAQYLGERAEIEGELNFQAISDVRDFADIVSKSTSSIVVRTLKYLLSIDIKKDEEFEGLLYIFGYEKSRDIYFAALGEGYYKIPAYQKNLERIKKFIEL